MVWVRGGLGLEVGCWRTVGGSGRSNDLIDRDEEMESRDGTRRAGCGTGTKGGGLTITAGGAGMSLTKVIVYQRW